MFDIPDPALNGGIDVPQREEENPLHPLKTRKQKFRTQKIIIGPTQPGGTRRRRSGSPGRT